VAKIEWFNFFQDTVYLFIYLLFYSACIRRNVLQVMKTEFVPKVTTVVASCSVIFVAVTLSDRLLTMRTLVSTGYLDALVNVLRSLHCLLYVSVP